MGSFRSMLLTVIVTISCGIGCSESGGSPAYSLSSVSTAADEVGESPLPMGVQKIAITAARRSLSGVEESRWADLAMRAVEGELRGIRLADGSILKVERADLKQSTDGELSSAKNMDAHTAGTLTRRFETNAVVCCEVTVTISKPVLKVPAEAQAQYEQEVRKWEQKNKTYQDWKKAPRPIKIPGGQWSGIVNDVTKAIGPSSPGPQPKQPSPAQITPYSVQCYFALVGPQGVIHAHNGDVQNGEQVTPQRMAVNKGELDKAIDSIIQSNARTFARPLHRPQRKLDTLAGSGDLSISAEAEGDTAELASVEARRLVLQKYLSSGPAKESLPCLSDRVYGLCVSNALIEEAPSFLQNERQLGKREDIHGRVRVGLAASVNRAAVASRGTTLFTKIRREGLPGIMVWIPGQDAAAIGAYDSTLCHTVQAVLLDTGLTNLKNPEQLTRITRDEMERLYRENSANFEAIARLSQQESSRTGAEILIVCSARLENVSGGRRSGNVAIQAVRTATAKLVWSRAMSADARQGESDSDLVARVARAAATECSRGLLQNLLTATVSGSEFSVVFVNVDPNSNERTVLADKLTGIKNVSNVRIERVSPERKPPEIAYLLETTLTTEEIWSEIKKLDLRPLRLDMDKADRQQITFRVTRTPNAASQSAGK